jgi:hypothetical protein
MAKVNGVKNKWQGTHNQHATEKECYPQNKPMTAVGYISDAQAIIKGSWSLFQSDGVAAITCSERSPLPQALCAKDLPGGRTQILNVRRNWRINRHPVESNNDIPPESTSHTNVWLHWNGDYDNSNDSE